MGQIVYLTQGHHDKHVIVNINRINVKTKRKPVHKPKKQPKKDWGTAALMIQKLILNLPGHPTQNRPDYSGMYTVL